MENSTAKKQYFLPKTTDYAALIVPWIGALEDTRRRTLFSLKDLSQQDLDWQPDWGGNSIGTLLYHIAAVEASWVYEEVLQKEFSPALEKLFPYPVRDEQGTLTSVKDVSVSQHLASLTQTRNATLAAYFPMSDADFSRKRSFETYEVTPEWVLHHLMQHEAEHRGQIGEIRAMAQAAH